MRPILYVVLLTALFLTTAQIAATPAIEASLNHPTRPAKDKLADQNRKPAKVLALAEVKPGDKVLDMFAGGGYYTELLSHLVGSDGLVISHNNDAYINFIGKGIFDRFENNRLTNVNRVLSEVDDLEFDENSLDVIFMILTIHDFYHASQYWPAIDTDSVLAEMYKALKPGGTLIVVDHIGPDRDKTENSLKLHRVYPPHAEKDLLAAGFKLVEKADFLENKTDPINIYMGHSSVKGKTSRFVFKLTK